MLLIEQVEIVVGGLAAEQTSVDGKAAAKGIAAVPVTDSTRIALRVGGIYRGKREEVAAHTSAVQVRDQLIYAQQGAVRLLGPRCDWLGRFHITGLHRWSLQAESHP